MAFVIGVKVQLFFADPRKVWKVGEVAGLDRAELSALFERRGVPAGMPILLDDAMRPVEPVSAWFRSMALDRMDEKTMRSYAYSVLMLLHFLQARGMDLQSAAEADIREFRLWRLEAADETVEQVSWDRDSAAIGGLYDFSSALVMSPPVRGGRHAGVRHWPAASAVTCAFGTWSLSSTSTAGTWGSAGWPPTRGWTRRLPGGSRTGTGPRASSR
ncbi:site-specific integrase [Streptomyces sp. NPDC005474]|uniref:site-specific integrase n=1 Tax=Streptomyces sp. NPDC005474 TaxID=3154878 RepID=UPI003451AA84